jgi:hypothetical protein
MKAFKAALFAGCVFAVMALSQGCALLLVGGATYGAVQYVDNKLQVIHDVSLDKAWVAANAALKELQMPVTSWRKDGASGRLEARNAQRQRVNIDLLRKSDRVTEIRIAVGIFDTAANRVGAQQIYDTMKARL